MDEKAYFTVYTAACSLRKSGQDVYRGCFSSTIVPEQARSESYIMRRMEKVPKDLLFID